MKKIGMMRTGILAIMGIALLMLLAMPSALAALDVITVDTPTAGANWTGTNTITWSNTSSGNYIGITYYVEYSATGVFTGISPTYCVGGANISNTTEELSWDTSGLAAGTSYKINVTRVNATTNVSGESGTFTVDNTNPAVAITGSSEGLSAGQTHIYTVATTITLTGTMTDAHAGNSNITAGTTTGTVTTTTWSVTSLPVATGCNVVTVSGLDGAANEGTGTITICRTAQRNGSWMPPTPTPSQPPAEGLLPLSIIPEEGLPDSVKRIGVIAVIAIVLFVVWRGSGSKSKRKRRR